MNQDAIQIALGTLQGILSSTGFILFLFIGFCVVAGFTKTRKTAGGRAVVVKSLDERVTNQPMEYFAPGVGRQKVDQLHSPELLEAAARK
jgi:hypothetical protein